MLPHTELGFKHPFATSTCALAILVSAISILGSQRDGEPRRFGCGIYGRRGLDGAKPRRRSDENIARQRRFVLVQAAGRMSTRAPRRLSRSRLRAVLGRRLLDFW